MTKADMGAITNRFSSAIWADPDAIPYAAWVSVWGRWLIWVVSVFNLAHRPDAWYPADIEYAFLHIPLVTLNGLVHYRLLTHRSVTWRWMLALSMMDFALITAGVVIGGGFNSFFFLAYYAALAVFAAVFTSLWVGLAWTTMVAVAYSIVIWGVGPGLDLNAGDETELVSRLTIMYAIVLCISLITRFERIRRHTAVERERKMQEERIELSQMMLHESNRALADDSRHGCTDGLHDRHGDTQGHEAG